MEICEKGCVLAVNDPDEAAAAAAREMCAEGCCLGRPWDKRIREANQKHAVAKLAQVDVIGILFLLART